MTIIDTVAGKALSRTALATALTAAALGLASPASADEKLITEKYIATEECGAVGAGQICPVDTNYWPTKTQFLARPPAIKVEFTANQNHCADMIAHVWIAGPGYNGSEWGSNTVHPGQSDGGYEIPINDAGLHQVGIQAEGIEGGCNTGSVSAWGGMLRISQLT
jgi:hypothetical protein